MIPNKIEFKPWSKYCRIYFNHVYIYGLYNLEGREELTEEKIQEEIGQSYKLSKEDQARWEKSVASMNKFLKSLNFLNLRISDKAYFFIKRRAYLLSTYTELEQYFFKCYKYILIANGIDEIKAERTTTEIIMKNNWINHYALPQVKR
ncbi:MAG: hypothetical protein JXA99_12300 [Candidatus Lokiarchaeota archaeon]|nr:hypothetical protein [Candidatus Lokiarchaeota archaeon]